MGGHGLLVWHIGKDGQLRSANVIETPEHGYLHAFAMTEQHLLLRTHAVRTAARGAHRGSRQGCTGQGAMVRGAVRGDLPLRRCVHPRRRHRAARRAPRRHQRSALTDEGSNGRRWGTCGQ
ncbi:hypothetical protein G6F40_015925 [Rhizopus arrhizus]|nr:hypothetical protein G6F40_015925 [Rhizopus arrhizus]